MSHEAYPSQSNISTYLGSNADWALEKQIVSWMSLRGACNREQFIYIGFELSNTGAGLSVNVLAGTGVINGRIVKTTGTENVASLQDGLTNYIILQATIISNLITGFTITSNTTGTVPTDALLLGTAVTAAGVVSSVASEPQKPGVITGSYTGDGAGSRTFPLRFQPRFVLVLSKLHDTLAFSGNSTGAGTVGYQISSGAAGTSTSINRRPELSTTGFLVGDDTTVLSLNLAAATYDYWAWY